MLMHLCSEGEDSLPVAMETARLHLRSLDESDEKLYCDLYTNADTMQFIGEPLSLDRALRCFHKAVQLTQESVFKQRVVAIVEKDTRRSIGLCGLRRIDEMGRRIEAGVMLSAEAQGRGYGKEAFGALVHNAFTTQAAVDEVVAQISAANFAMQAVASGAGFSRCSNAAATDGPSVNDTWSVCRESWSCNAITNT